MSKFLLYIIFITKDRKSHYVWNTFYSVGWSSSVCNFIIYIFIYLFIYLFSVIVVHLDYVSYTRDYDIREYNDMSHCDYLDYKNKATKWKLLIIKRSRVYCCKSSYTHRTSKKTKESLKMNKFNFKFVNESQSFLSTWYFWHN